MAPVRREGLLKREAVSSTKMKKLCKLLKLPLYAATGLLELLWHLTAREAPQGDIGKLSNEDIALALDYEGDADQMIDALVNCRWLDPAEHCRLIVHDWHVHSDDAVDLRLARAILFYANGARPRMKRLGSDERAHICAQYMHTVRTNSHNGAPPEPVPVPDPVPGKISDANASSPRQKRRGDLEISPSEAIYQEYPRKEGHDAAIRAIDKAVRRIRKGGNGKPPIPDLRDARIFLYKRVIAYARSPAGSRPDREMIPHPSTWFNQGRYHDNEAEWQHTGGQNGRPGETRQDRTDANFRELAEEMDHGGITPDRGDDARRGQQGENLFDRR